MESDVMLKRMTAGFIILSVALIFVLTACGSEKKKVASEVGSAPVENSVAVVYFSATGTTKGIARKIADVLDAETFEIVPKEAYSSDDLDYNEDSCRANQEMNDESSRPGIENDLSAVKEFDRIYIGYPIWWGTAPRIIQTFLDTNDLSGKKVYLFCTSGGSGIEESVRDSQKLYPDVNIVSGKRFEAGASEDEVKDWLDELK